MSTRPEIVLYSSLIDTDRLEYLAREGVDLDIVPTSPMRPVVDWALRYFFDSGCKQAPSREALELEWGPVLEAEEIHLEDPDEEYETPAWALEYLRSQYVYLQWQNWSKKAATDIASAMTSERVGLFAQHTNELGVILRKVTSQSNEAAGSSAIEDALRRYHDRVALDGAPQGLLLGLGHLDEHTHGIHPGELAIMAAGPKTGKSWLLALAVLTEWRRGRRSILYTLENSVEMTVDRILCLHANVSYRAFQRGELSDSDLSKVEMSRQMLRDYTGDCIAVMPKRGQRTIDAMTRDARMRGVDSIIIDQLTFVEAVERRNARHEVLRDIMHDLKTEISTGDDKIPCLMAHQINREGVKAADKTGHLEMWMLAESSEVERTADWVFGVYRRPDDRIAEIARLQVLASRREDLNAWMMAYNPGFGIISTTRELVLSNGETDGVAS